METRFSLTKRSDCLVRSVKNGFICTKVELGILDPFIHFAYFDSLVESQQQSVVNSALVPSLLPINFRYFD